jgi:hypothetical protein
MFLNFIFIPGLTGLSQLVAAEKLLNSIDENASFLKYCGSNPKIIGSCQFKPNPRNDMLSFARLNDMVGHTMR